MSETMTETRERLMRISAVCEMVDLSRSAIYRHMAAGTFPKPLNVGSGGSGGVMRWRQSEVAAWIDTRPVQQ